MKKKLDEKIYYVIERVNDIIDNILTKKYYSFYSRLDVNDKNIIKTMTDKEGTTHLFQWYK